ncbi:MAG: winged helix-turn-helix domain-containing protein, partial [Pseudomonadales bacterium]
GNLKIDLDRRHIFWRNEPLKEFTMTEFAMLEFLARRPDQVLTYQQLAQATFGGCVENNTISTHISNIKRKFKAVSVNFNNIVSEYGQGYRWRS